MTSSDESSQTSDAEPTGGMPTPADVRASAESATNTTKTVAQRPCKTVAERLAREAEDALVLLEHALLTGYKAADGRSISESIVSAIRRTAEILICQDEVDRKMRAQTDAPAWPTSAEIVQFELGLFALASLMKPITAESLRDTSDEAARHRSLLGRIVRRLLGMTMAHRFSKVLMLVTLFFMALAIYGAVLDFANGPIEDGVTVEGYTWVQVVLQLLVPFTYGGMGACVYLLRSLHRFIYERTFDRNRRAEYYSRILLGVVSGGTITLFASHVGLGEGEGVTLSASALGFIAGYNTDFLFSALERLVAAILPKIDISSIRANPPGTSTVVTVDNATIDQLLARLAAATDPAERELIRSLIERIRDKL